MLPVDGSIVAPPQVRPESWAHALSESSALLILAPGSMRGWFAGHAVVAWSASGVSAGLSLEEAAHELESPSAPTSPVLAAAVLSYDGSATVARYDGGLVWTTEGWRVWGTLGADDVPVPDADARVRPRCCPLGRRWRRTSPQTSMRPPSAGGFERSPRPYGQARSTC